MAETFDIAIVGAGITGCAIARQLARYDLSICVVEAANDIALGASKANGGLVQLVPPLLTKLNSQVPWQFYAQVTANWDLLQRFLVKELPAVPLDQRLRVTAQLSTGQLNQLVAEQLAQKGAAATLLGRGPLPPAQTQLVAKQLLAALYRDGQVDWQQVRALLAPLPYQPAPDLDLPTRQWLTALAQQPGLTGAN